MFSSWPSARSLSRKSRIASSTDSRVLNWRARRACPARQTVLRLAEERGFVGLVGLEDGRPPGPLRHPRVGVLLLRDVELVGASAWRRTRTRAARSVPGPVDEGEGAVLDDGGVVAGDVPDGPAVVVVAVVVRHRFLEQPLVEVGRVVAGGPVVEVLAEQARAVTGLVQLPLHGGVLVQVVGVAGVQDAVVVRVPARHDRGAGGRAQRGVGVRPREVDAVAAEPVDGPAERPVGLLGLVVGDDEQDVGAVVAAGAGVRGGRRGGQVPYGCGQVRLPGTSCRPSRRGRSPGSPPPSRPRRLRPRRSACRARAAPAPHPCRRPSHPPCPRTHSPPAVNLLAFCCSWL